MAGCPQDLDLPEPVTSLLRLPRSLDRVSPHSQQMALLSCYPVPLQITPWWLLLLCSMNKQPQCSLLLREYSIIPLPPNSCITTTHLDRWGYAILTGWATTTPHEMAEPTTVRELIATWEDNWSLLCGSNFCHVASVMEAIVTGTAIAVSDGSYMPKMCTQLAMASWCIENPLTTLGCHGLAQVSGTKAETNAY